MTIQHGLRAGLRLPEIGRFVTRARVQLNMTRQQSTSPYMDPWRPVAWVLEEIIAHYIDWALAGARWIKPEDFANGKCCDTAP